MAGLDSEKLEFVFQSRPDILEGIQTAADTPTRVRLFNNIASFVAEQLAEQLADPSEPSSKRRRVDVAPSQNGVASNGTSAAPIADVANESILLEIKDISVSVPQRKKFDLCFTGQHIYCRLPGKTEPMSGMIYAWKDIEYAFHLPVPEKAQLQYNYLLFPRNSCLSALSKTPTNGDPEPLVFTVTTAAPKPGSIGGQNAGAAEAVSDSYITLFNWALNKCLKAGKNNVQIVAADPNKFHSVIRQSHRPKEQAVHVKAFRGSKDGFLFFLENGILWGFKKPLMFIPLHRIAAVSYTNVLSRTFNMTVEVFTNEGGEAGATEELDFAMLDQEDYSGINENYVMKHNLQDRSLADQRKAKIEMPENQKGGKKGANGADGGEANGDAAAEDGMTELERARFEAEQQLQDDEDEDEEDYDPGSDGDSDGSGTSSEEDDDDEDDEGGGDDDDDEEMDEASAEL